MIFSFFKIDRDFFNLYICGQATVSKLIEAVGNENRFGRWQNVSGVRQ